jgi:hypothetical protein
MAKRSSTNSKNKVLIPIMLIIAAAAFLMGLGISPVTAGQVANNSIQNNVEVSSSQLSFDNASDYFIFPSQKELFSEQVFKSTK